MLRGSARRDARLQERLGRRVQQAGGGGVVGVDRRRVWRHLRHVQRRRHPRPRGRPLHHRKCGRTSTPST
eukprot:7339543-Pyramimonas_sp.AAC.1